MPNLFWIRSQNLGDSLNFVLYKAITKAEPVWSDQPGKILAIGSLAHLAAPGDILWGVGAMSDDMYPHCDHATKAIAVRGPLTAWMFKKQGVDISDTVFGDPAILIPQYFKFPRKKGQEEYILVVPHYADCELAMKYDWPENYKVVSPMKNTLELIELIARADAVVSSSLHAIIVAESYDVPAVWVEFSDNVRGNGFKFHDYYFSTWRNPPLPIQIRDEKLPEHRLMNAILDWPWPERNLETLGDTLLNCCPFVI